MNAEHINPDKIDNGIKDLVYALDQIPFTSPIEGLMCEGHLRDTASGTFRPESRQIFIFGANVGFFVDDSYPNASPFLEEVRSLKAKYHFLDLHQHHCEDDCRIEDAYIVNLDYSDLTHPNTIGDEDDLETMIRKRHQIDPTVGQKRITEYQEVWSDFLLITKKYLERSQAKAPSS